VVACGQLLPPERPYARHDDGLSVDAAHLLERSGKIYSRVEIISRKTDKSSFAPVMAILSARAPARRGTTNSLSGATAWPP